MAEAWSKWRKNQSAWPRFQERFSTATPGATVSTVQAIASPGAAAGPAMEKPPSSRAAVASASASR